MAKSKQHSRSTISTHANAVYAEWAALQRRLSSKSAAVSINGSDLSISDVVAVSFHDATATLSQDPECIRQVDESVAFLARELESGNVIYGVNTGFGGSADTRTQQFERLQSAAIQHLNVGILTQADKSDSSSADQQKNELLRGHALPNPIVKAAMLIRCNSLMRGHSGVRISVIDSVMKLLSKGMAPVVPLRGSISASGDLSTLSYIAGAVEGNPDIFVRANVNGERKIIPANEGLKLANIEPVRLQAKEGLGITNGTAPSCAAASIVLHQANQLALLVQLLTAMGTEALDGTAHNYHPFISAIRPHQGQAEAASNILAFLSGSKISPNDESSNTRIGLAQDRYALRTAPQWIGPQLEDLQLATRQVSTELNSTTDNPLIDAVNGHIHHGGNFQAMVLTSAMEKTMTALQNLGRIIFAQSSEIINNMTNKGLPPNLSVDDPSQSFTCKGFDVNMAAYAAELAYLAHPVSTHVQVAEMTNQSINSMALVSARYALEAVEVLSLMAATYIYVLCQALDLRCMQIEFRQRFAEKLEKVVAEWYTSVGGDVGVSQSALELSHKMGGPLLQKWDQLSHLDLDDRCAATVKETLGEMLENIGFDGLTLRDTRQYQDLVVAALNEVYSDVRAEFIRSQKTPEYISPASRVVYGFVRDELRVPLNRGVEDHPPLLQRNAASMQNGASKPNGTNGANGVNGHHVKDENLAARSRILGTMAGEIYEACGVIIPVISLPEVISAFLQQQPGETTPSPIHQHVFDRSSPATSQQPLARGAQVTSPSGRSYIIYGIIYQRSRGNLLCRLYRASHEGKQYVLKDILPGDFQYILELQKLVDGSAHVRTLVDSIPDRHMFVYPFLDTNLQLVKTTAIASSTKKNILRDALAGLAGLHDKGVYHTGRSSIYYYIKLWSLIFPIDIKPANIMMDSFKQSDGTIGFRNVQITDLEDAVVLPPDSQGLGKRLSGNQFWRSPEAWARAAQHTAADIFSFGIVAIYVWLDRMIFFSDEANKAEDSSDIILRLHVSHFVNDVDDFGGFVEYYGGEEDPFVQRFIRLLSTFNGEDKKRAPFSRWHPVDPQFKDLVSKMTCLDPLRRITAREALQHPWFSE
ncbi:L-Aspartase-like protein [Cladorrhinum sp. PSN332]|nr:L-Aspartase-like protein [Cladorrhinum sp. PSN332]